MAKKAKNGAGFHATAGFHAARNDDRDDHYGDPDVDCASDLYPVDGASARGRLRKDLFELRKLISQYTLDKQKGAAVAG